MTLQDMTQAKWNGMSRVEREILVDLSGLTPQLIGLEGSRVEVITRDGEIRRFIVARSNGWRPCHIELPNRRSRCGMPASSSYLTVKFIRKGF